MPPTRTCSSRLRSWQPRPGSCKVIKAAVTDAKDKLLEYCEYTSALCLRCGVKCRDSVDSSRSWRPAAYIAPMDRNNCLTAACANSQQGAQEQGAGAARDRAFKSGLHQSARRRGVAAMAAAAAACRRSAALSICCRTSNRRRRRRRRGRRLRLRRRGPFRELEQGSTSPATRFAIHSVLPLQRPFDGQPGALPSSPDWLMRQHEIGDEGACADGGGSRWTAGKSRRCISISLRRGTGRRGSGGRA